MLERQNALVIGGGGGGIGRAVTRALAAAGARVAVADVDQERAQEAASESTGQSAYGAAKAGLASLARSVAAEYSREGIRMNVVAAGPIATPVAQAAQADTELDWIPMGRAGTPEEVAAAVVFLASPTASSISGQSLVVDGGRVGGRAVPDALGQPPSRAAYCVS